VKSSKVLYCPECGEISKTVMNEGASQPCIACKTGTASVYIMARQRPVWAGGPSFFLGFTPLGSGASFLQSFRKSKKA
jgi:hypothetical protein